MSQASFAYSTPANDPAGLPVSLSIYADRPHIRGQIRDDALAAGLRITEDADIATLLDGDVRPLGEIVVLDCPVLDGTKLAALVRLDERAAHCGAQLIVSTSVEALDDVFACLDQSDPQLLVDPSRADRMIALGRVLGRMSGRRLRELSEEDRLMLLRLTEQVNQIAQRLDRLAAPAGQPEPEGNRLAAPQRGFSGAAVQARSADSETPSLPDARLIRQIIRQRQMRNRFFEEELFADPAWDILLDLTAARAENAKVSVTSLCIASGVPPTTALRWIGQMTESGWLERVSDAADRRRAFITLSDKAVDAMGRLFAEWGDMSGQGL